MLKSRIRLTTLKGAATLFERGDFIDYAPGEKYHSELGLISFGRRSDEGDMRMFYFYPEEFPEVYSMKEEAKQLPATGVRRLLGLINGVGG